MENAMSRLIITLLVSLSLLVGAACSGEPAKDTPPAATPATAPGVPALKIAYAAGFYDEERDAGNAWRWMGPEGVVRLKNTGRDMTLTITGSSPLGPLKGAPTVTVTLNGQQLEQFPGAEAITKQYTITPAQQGPGEYSELRIASSKSFVPQEVNPQFQDSRRLAFSLGKLTWEEKVTP
jgi:hypothetical protein